ncbi:UPF0450 protein C17orf58-like [Hippopotamus amphibius kiboko]|uniref:UPF0450 protein C17orf58-like n=1 Tax=Hippopotamus amphibius kiboko TaxID=575201 RepID=UPI00259562A0|nr:UPF0450 protein C17orf58-like [Hippopotamus amphibius kiboko]
MEPPPRSSQDAHGHADANAAALIAGFLRLCIKEREEALGQWRAVHWLQPIPGKELSQGGASGRTRLRRSPSPPPPHSLPCSTASFSFWFSSLAEVKAAEISLARERGEEQKAQSEPEQGAAPEGKEAGDEGEGKEGGDVGAGPPGPRRAKAERPRLRPRLRPRRARAAAMAQSRAGRRRSRRRSARVQMAADGQQRAPPRQVHADAGAAAGAPFPAHSVPQPVQATAACKAHGCD